MAGWGRVVAGAILGVAGTIYATNEEARKNLPKTARDLPVQVRRRFRSAVDAAREASSTRRDEILRDLEDHGGGEHAARGIQPETPDGSPAPEDSLIREPVDAPPDTPASAPIGVPYESPDKDRKA